METKMQLEKEIESLEKEQKEFIEEYNVRKPYHSIDIFEEKSVARAILEQTNEIIEIIEEITFGCNENLEELQGSCGDISFSNQIMLCKSCSPTYFKIQEVLVKIRGEK